MICFIHSWAEISFESYGCDHLWRLSKRACGRPCCSLCREWLASSPLTPRGEASCTNWIQLDIRNVWRDMHANFDAGPMKGKFDSSYQFPKKVAIVNEGASDAVALLGLIRLVDYLSQPDYFGRDRKLQLVVDCGTGTTAIGLALAILILRLPWEVIGVTLVGGVENFRNLTEKLVDDFKMSIETTNFEITQAGLQHCLKWTERPRPRKFGKVLEGEIQACQKIARETGILLDPVYTLAAWEVASTLTSSKEREVVMLHTGGTLGLFGLAQRYASEFSP